MRRSAPTPGDTFNDTVPSTPGAPAAVPSTTGRPRRAATDSRVRTTTRAVRPVGPVTVTRMPSDATEVRVTLALAKATLKGDNCASVAAASAVNHAALLASPLRYPLGRFFRLRIPRLSAELVSLSTVT